MKSLGEIKLALKSVGGLLLTSMTVDFTHYILLLLKSNGKTKTQFFSYFLLQLSLENC